MRRWFSRGALVLVPLAFLTIAAFVIFKATQLANDDPHAITLPTNLTTIAVFPFEVRGSSDYFYLGEGMVDLLGAKLNGAGELRSVDSRALLSYLRRKDLRLDTPAKAREVARHFNAAYYIQGEILEAGGRLSLNATLYDAAKA